MKRGTMPSDPALAEQPEAAPVHINPQGLRKKFAKVTVLS